MEKRGNLNRGSRQLVDPPSPDIDSIVLADDQVLRFAPTPLRGAPSGDLVLDCAQCSGKLMATANGFELMTPAPGCPKTQTHVAEPVNYDPPRRLQKLRNPLIPDAPSLATVDRCSNFRGFG